MNLKEENERLRGLLEAALYYVPSKKADLRELISGALSQQAEPALVQDEREAFEAWYERTFGARAFVRNVDHSYQEPETEMLWAGWQARAARPAQSEQQPIGYACQADLDWEDEPIRIVRDRFRDWQVPLYAAPKNK